MQDPVLFLVVILVLFSAFGSFVHVELNADPGRYLLFMSAVSLYCLHHFCVKLKLSFLFLIATCMALYRSLFTLTSVFVGLCAYLHTDTGILFNFSVTMFRTNFIWELMLTYRIFKLKTRLENLAIVCVACLCFPLCQCLHYDSKENGNL
jgi:hypothetical protein